MSSRSRYRPRKLAVMVPKGGPQPPVDWAEQGPALVVEWRPMPEVGRHLRRIMRRNANAAEGNFAAQIATAPMWCSEKNEETGRFGLNKPLRRLFRKVQAAHRTRSCCW